MTLCTTETIPPGEWARHPAPLQEEAFQDGWLQRLGGRPLYYLRYLTDDDLAAWDAGYEAARRSLVCVQRSDQPTPERVDVELAPTLPVDDACVDQPVAPALPEAPYFDGTQVCAQVDPELFFPEKGGSSAGAKKLCSSCEFLAPCLDYALVARINGMGIAGVWGGTSDRDRQRIRRGLVAGAPELDEDLVDQLETGAVA